MTAANQHCGDDDANKISANLLRICKDTDGSSMLEDTDSVADLPEVLYVVLQVSDNEWEPVDVMSTEFTQEAS